MTGWVRLLLTLVEESTGITLPRDSPAERQLVSYFWNRARGLGLASPMPLLLRLEAEPIRSPEWTRLIGRLTNGQTCFFRDNEQFSSIATVLSEISREAAGRPLEIWSCACATGEEAYSLAILCRERGIDARVRATDINPLFLAVAREGRYDEWVLRHLDDRNKEKWFQRECNRRKVLPSIREMVRFEHHNLAADPPMTSGRADGRWDLISCRNVLLYFRRERMEETCLRLSSALPPRGAFVLSACESLYGLDVPLACEKVGTRVVYRPQVRRASLRPRPVARQPTSVEQESAVRGGASAPAPERLDALTTAALLARAGRLNEAKRIMNEELEREESMAASLALGHLHLRDHEFNEALAAYERAKRMDSLLAEVHFFKGLLFRKAGRWSQAHDALRHALFLAPGFWQAAHLLAGVHDREGRPRQARRERALAARLLEESPGSITFISDSVFTEWFCPSKSEVKSSVGLLSTRSGYSSPRGRARHP